MVHLFRTLSHAPLSSPGARSTALFVVAVPNYFSPDDFIRFCGPRIDDVSELRFIRNDGMEDRYSVLIELTDQKAADGFFCTFNGKNFSPAERLDPDTSGILSTQCDHSFHCSCGTKWTYLSCQVCRLCQQQDEVPSCFICGTMENLWVCLICGFVGCGRYRDKHAISHWKNTQHCYSLDLRTQQIWDYVRDTYLLEMNSYCESLEGDCGSCGCSEDSEISGALFSSKIEAIHADYIHLASTQLEAQRKKGVTSKIEDIHSKLGKLGDEKKAVAELNQTLIKNQDMMRRKVKEIEERSETLRCILEPRKLSIR
ncbi:hypothetical protein EUGRSUZ_C01418 [Eucalyptus grandis]|uniref:Uncharacterized protein n=1 Tax=Eucalyptus grandis TaxID=71139 RepID=A0ACC3LDG1_EUCGR|nr:hypothetical protein EUGRSUZ_C01418 [Eucalyptus grandis]